MKADRMKTDGMETDGMKTDGMEVNIALALDNNYMMPTYVAIYSMLQNINKEVGVNIYFLTPHFFTEENIQILQSFAHMYTNVRCEIVTMGHKFEKAHAAVKHITYPTYYRLMLPVLLEHVERCIYLDGDILVLGDISKMLRFEMEEYYVGGVKSPVYHVNCTEDVLENIGLKSNRQFINAGVLIMNLKKMREENVTARFLKLMENQYPGQDQDIINLVCFNHILLLPPKFNAQVVGLSYPDEELEQVFSSGEITEARTEPCIVHFSSHIVKPWLSKRFKYCDIWWDYFSRTIYNKEADGIRENIRMTAAAKLPAELRRRLGEREEIILFGFSVFGKTLLCRLLEAESGKVICFCDNDTAKHGQVYLGVTVKTPEEITRLGTAPFIIITSQRHASEMEMQLHSMGIDEKNIYKYTHAKINDTRHAERALRNKEEYL